VNRFVLFASSAILLGSPVTQCQTNPVHLCAVQVRSEYQEPATQDAYNLAQELKGRTLADSSPVVTTLVNGTHHRPTTAQLQQSGCDWVVEVWRKPTVDAVVPDDQMVPGALTVRGEVTPDGNEGIYYELRKVGVAKVALKGAIPATVVYAHFRGGRTVSYYPALASNIVEAVNRSRR